MAITNSSGKKLFLSVDHNWNGQGFVFTYPTLYPSQANDYMEYLPVYLAHSHGEEVYCWFTPNVVTEAKAMGWDEEKNQPILKDGLDLRSSIQSFDLEWCIAPLSSASLTSAAVDMDNITLPSFNTVTQSALAQPGTPSIAPNAVPNLVLHSTVDHPDDITMALMVDTRLAAFEHTCALLPSILKKLEALSPPQTTTTVQGSTSTLTASSPPSTQGSALGMRD